MLKKIIPMAKTNETTTISTNMITAGTIITGDVSCESDIRLEGTLNGNLVVKGKVVIGGTGIVKGEIKCQNCDVEGTLEGKITANELLCLRATAKVMGDMHVNKLAIEPGAIFTGLCNMNLDHEKTTSHNGMAKKEELTAKKA